MLCTRKFITESDGELPVLDTLPKRKPDETISVLVYRKPTHTDQYFNYNSNHPAKTKDAVVSSLFRRAKDIISDKDDLEKENERIVKVLCDNDFKKSDITKVKEKMDRPRNDQRSDDAADNEQKFISLPYIKGTSETLKRIFATHKIKSSL